MAKGLPMAEAKEQAAEIEKEIRALVRRWTLRRERSAAGEAEAATALFRQNPRGSRRNTRSMTPRATQMPSQRC
jgi:hypothetical protein